MSSRFTLRLGPETRRRLDELAAASGHSRAAVVRRLIEERPHEDEGSGLGAEAQELTPAEDSQRLAGYRVTVRHKRVDPEEAERRGRALMSALARGLQRLKRESSRPKSAGQSHALSSPET
jgi:predicted DNA-binding protein